MSAEPKQVGIVVIGRNEGALLARCLGSLPGEGVPVVYADSGSTDDSVARAAALGAEVVALDDTRPHTPGRGRNAGARRLLELHPKLEFVHFVDGDCELVPGWVERAVSYLAVRLDVAVVTGRLRERNRNRNAWHRLADMEWGAAIGEVEECGGIALIRADAFRESGGFDEAMPGGEEPELCVRLRGAGHRVMRLSHEMATHDADMDRFSQWWNRGVRSGHAYAQGFLRHRSDGYRLRELRSIFFWTVGLPLAALVLAPLTRGLSLLALVGYAVLWLRIRRARLRRGDVAADAALYANAVVVGKFAQTVGAVGSLLRGAGPLRAATDPAATGEVRQ